ncbi:RNA-guided endonuclease TnpB family protein [Glycomyces sp. NPDC049804]|uniref:RNA-guided endonuclease InsQ/TnpB family protein n=1 Tax=Glycomyces sp. NPDC049804 TaxID=3154363 RepID=UPI00341496FE
MQRGFRVRMYPDQEQAALLCRTLGCVRVVWNHVLAWRRERWAQARLNTSYEQASAHLTELKRSPEFAYLREVSSVPLQQALRHQQRAFDNFFAKRANHPRFKARSNCVGATFAKTAFRLRSGRLHLAKMKEPLQWVWSFDIPVEELSVSSVTITREPDGSWWVSLCAELAEDQAPEEPAPTGRSVGVDLGVHTFGTLSDGAAPLEAPDLKSKERNRKRYQRRMARKQRGSKNRDKARMKVARAYRKERQAREDMLQKATTRLVRQYDTICLEDLNVRGLRKNRRMAGLIARLGWQRFRALLEAKCARAGKRLVVIDRWEPSSKRCSNADCGFMLEELRLEVRIWTCPSCGARHDRDLNAAKNILAAGLAVLAGEHTRVSFEEPESAADKACGVGVRPRGLSPPGRPAVKQEATSAMRWDRPRNRGVEAKSPLL